MVDQTVFDLHPREIAERLHDEDMQAMAGRPVFNREVETRDAGGHARWRCSSRSMPSVMLLIVQRR